MVCFYRLWTFPHQPEILLPYIGIHSMSLFLLSLQHFLKHRFMISHPGWSPFHQCNGIFGLFFPVLPTCLRPLKKFLQMNSLTLFLWELNFSNHQKLGSISTFGWFDPQNVPHSKGKILFGCPKNYSRDLISLVSIFFNQNMFFPKIESFLFFSNILRHTLFWDFSYMFYFLSWSFASLHFSFTITSHLLCFHNELV